MSEARSTRMSRDDARLAAAVYAFGAAVYYIIIEVVDVTFDATPALIGAIALVASIFRRTSLAPAILLLCWGAGVLLTRHGPLPDEREAATFVVAFGVGMLILAALSRGTSVIDAASALGSAAAVMLVGGAGFYLAFKDDVFLEPWPWALGLLATSAAIIGSTLIRLPARHTASDA
jgi:hypothetical protein